MEGSFGSDFGGAAGAGGGKLDPGLIMEQVKVQIAVANAQELLQRMTNKCFRKCIGKPGSSLDNSEQVRAPRGGRGRPRGPTRAGGRGGAERPLAAGANLGQNRGILPWLVPEIPLKTESRGACEDRPRAGGQMGPFPLASLRDTWGPEELVGLWGCSRREKGARTGYSGGTPRIGTERSNPVLMGLGI
uniref:Tim10-like domain-containing protein n=1 Tax=Sarcophilus harrisii TaxID=9305 RepID=A0A7N4NIT6_SARHA